MEMCLLCDGFFLLPSPGRMLFNILIHFIADYYNQFLIISMTDCFFHE